LATFLASPALPAHAQFQPRTLEDPPTGEQYHVEGSAGFWGPNANMVIASTGLGIVGTQVDFKRDLGLTDARFKELHLVLRPARKHKLRLDYIPMTYADDAGHAVNREIVFNGQRYVVGLPVRWLIDWRAYRYAYEYDFIQTNRGFGGLILEAKYTKLTASLRTPLQAEAEGFRVRGPLPAIGGIGRGYVTQNISVTGEISGISIPSSVGEQLGGSGSYIDYNFYGTVNMTHNVGAHIGYRVMDVAVNIPGSKGGDGNVLLKGLYFGVVARY
jgi:hypothetical protein